MLTVDIIPGRSIKVKKKWEFALGMGVNNALTILQKEIDSIKNIKVLYDLYEPFSSDIKILLYNDGICLDFDGSTQVLKRIEIFDLSKVNITYENQYINKENCRPTLETAQNILGATKPKEYDPVMKMYSLNFRGLVLYFKSESEETSKMISETESEENLYYNNAVSLWGQSLVIYGGKDPDNPKLLPLPLDCYFNHCFLDSLEVIRNGSKTLGIKVVLKLEKMNPVVKTSSKMSYKEISPRSSLSTSLTNDLKEVTIHFGETEESVCTKLGSPSRIYYKEDQRMKIHLEVKKEKPVPDYFYNYFTYGLDVLIDGITHKVMKFVLHTNNIGSNIFGQYFQCPFKVPLPEEFLHDAETTSLEINSMPESEKHSIEIISNSKKDFKSLPISCSKKDSKETAKDLMNGTDVSSKEIKFVTPLTKWNTVKSLIAFKNKKPVILNREHGFNNDQVFRTTLTYGCQDMIFEVMKNNLLASICLFTT